MKPRSLSAARASLPSLIDSLAKETAIPITRRGKIVAVLIPPERFDELERASTRFTERLAKWNLDHDREDEALDARFFRDLRDRSEGR